MIPALLSAIVVALLFARFLFVLSAATFMTGSIGFEMLGGWYADRHPGPTLIYETLSSFEEFLEMCGVILLIAGLLDYASRRLGQAEIIWDMGSRTQ